MPETPPERKRWRLFRREAIDLGDVAVQILSVVVGILLALAINDWVQHREQQANINAAMRAIHAELAANRATVRKDAVVLYRTARQMMISPKNQNRPPRPCYNWDQFELPAVTLTNAAYQTAISTQALAHMPFKRVQRIAEVYGAQHSFLNGRSEMERHIMMITPQTLDMCVLWLQGAAQIDRGTDAAYAPMIGRDKLKWPVPYTGWTPLPSG